jgi:Cdc6-like AAA superfamily ATPase
MFKKATKSRIKVRLALSGASGSGKTFSALAIASELGKSIAVIDTEHGSASRYADRFNFDVCELTNHHPVQYIQAIEAAEQGGYEVIIIDSLSHAWFSELELASKGFDGWKNVRPLERKLIVAMVGSTSHIIATMRSKTEWVMEEYTAKDGRTKIAPKKIGTAPVQSSGIEYEFDVAGELNHEHILTISKSRCSELTDRTFLNPGREIAEILKTWIESGVSEAPTSPTPTVNLHNPSLSVSQRPHPKLSPPEQDATVRSAVEAAIKSLNFKPQQVQILMANNYYQKEHLDTLTNYELTQLVQYLDFYARSSEELKKAGWTPAQGQEFLKENFGGKKNRVELTLNEIIDFVTFLQESN